MKVEHRVRQAEENRIQLLRARLQRRAALEERTKGTSGKEWRGRISTGSVYGLRSCRSGIQLR